MNAALSSVIRECSWSSSVDSTEWQEAKLKKRQQAKDKVPQKWRTFHPNNMVCIVSPILRGSQHLSTRPISSVKSRAFRKLVTGWSAWGEKSGSKAFPMIKGCADASQAPRFVPDAGGTQQTCDEKCEMIGVMTCTSLKIFKNMSK